MIKQLKQLLTSEQRFSFALYEQSKNKYHIFTNRRLIVGTILNKQI